VIAEISLRAFDYVGTASLHVYMAFTKNQSYWTGCRHGAEAVLI
jgi:hypothetical protein